MMTPLPRPLGTSEVFAWRVDQEAHAASWDSGIGAEIVGGRWNSVGVRTVYMSLDPSTAILEVAVHKTFPVLDTVPHVLSSLRVHDPADIRVVMPDEVPNPNWLVPGTPGHGQMAYGDSLLAGHPFVLLPSAVSSHSWNLVFHPASASGRYTHVLQERLRIDTRPNPPPVATP